jgi:transcriptional/translational regulatory protein YebC/TACO1
MCIIVCFAGKNNNGNYKAKKLQREERQGTICRKLSLEMISCVKYERKI